eukprot:CAMPEP_0204619498 /NCGR_PEP_ID=MMETSP0717-20131115/5857_1 /ASSEMBLY_ACC=CAM_ASM_000666 /TAXON_ID=230516 /ORGANISM="Chaetoceros curvisetus" /LENGTH=240 /DNA_ID=CAMNT_0051633513 /DNA_START=90 /DNA_END=810 /DNA_ORIENTATION=+
MVFGNVPSKTLMRTSAMLYPLSGFFNVIIYTRWNVSSWRRKHPECSRLQAFWLILKAGGDVPKDIEWNESSAWIFSRLSCPFRTQTRTHGGERHHASPAVEELARTDSNHVGNSLPLNFSFKLECTQDARNETPEEIDDLHKNIDEHAISTHLSTNNLTKLNINHGSQDPRLAFEKKVSMKKNQPVYSSFINSVSGMHGMSESFDEEGNICYRSKDDGNMKEVKHVLREKSMIQPIVVEW